MELGILKVIKQLENKQQEFLDKAAKIGATIASIKEVFGDQLTLPHLLPDAAPETGSRGRGEYAGMSIGDAGVAYLRKAGAATKTRTIANALEAGGLSSRDMYRALYNALVGRDDVRLNGKKEWELTEWAQG